MRFAPPFENTQAAYAFKLLPGTLSSILEPALSGRREAVSRLATPDWLDTSQYY
jgi:hypothetical protein